MTQEEKKLLLTDLCARLPYGVKCTTKSSWNGIYTIEGYKDNRVFLDCPVYDEGDDEWMIESIVPYLRPMDSMTKEEKKEYESLCILIPVNYDSDLSKYDYYTTDSIDSFDWLNAHHFDYRGLILKGLAIAVTEENNPYK